MEDRPFEENSNKGRNSNGTYPPNTRFLGASDCATILPKAAFKSSTVICVFVRKMACEGRIKIPDLIEGLPKSLEKVLCPLFIDDRRRGMPLHIRELRVQS